MLEFLTRLIGETMCIEQCTAYNIWDVLFSDYFFGAGLKYTAIAAAQINGRIPIKQITQIFIFNLLLWFDCIRNQNSRR